MAPGRKMKTKWKSKKRHTIATQVTARDLDEAYEALNRFENTPYLTYTRCMFTRKRDNYRKLFVGGTALRTSSTVLRRRISYIFGPAVIYKRESRCKLRPLY